MTTKLDRLRALHAAATPGDWFTPDCEGSETVTSDEGDEIANCATKLCSSGQADADSIAATHNALPSLLACVDALRALAPDHPALAPLLEEQP